MRIVFVSTFLTQCGIATYTEALASEMAKQGHSVVVLAEAEPNLKIKDTSPVPYYRTWLRGTFRGEAFANSIINATGDKIDVVHFQHEFGIFPNNEEFIEALDRLNKAHIATVVTLHTVRQPPYHAVFADELRRAASAVVVHTPAAQTISSWGERVHIPHGLIWRPQPTNFNSNVLLCPGFVSESKGHKEIIDGFAIAVDHHKSVGTVLKIAGLCRDHMYLQKLEGHINQYGLGKRIILESQYITDDQLVVEMKNARAIILGANKESPYSVSGQQSLALGLNKPIIAKNVPIYNHTPVGLYNTAEELANFLCHPDAFVTDELAAIAQLRTWDKIVGKHVELYKDL